MSKDLKSIYKGNFSMPRFDDGGSAYSSYASPPSFDSSGVNYNIPGVPSSLTNSAGSSPDYTTGGGSGAPTAQEIAALTSGANGAIDTSGMSGNTASANLLSSSQLSGSGSGSSGSSTAGAGALSSLLKALGIGGSGGGSGSSSTTSAVNALAALLGAAGAYKQNSALAPKFAPPALFGGTSGTSGTSVAPGAAATGTQFGPAGGYNYKNYAGLTQNSPGLGYAPQTQSNPNIPSYYTYGQKPQASFFGSATQPVATAPTSMKRGGHVKKFAFGGPNTGMMPPPNPGAPAQGFGPPPTMPNPMQGGITSSGPGQVGPSMGAPPGLPPRPQTPPGMPPQGAPQAPPQGMPPRPMPQGGPGQQFRPGMPGHPQNANVLGNSLMKSGVNPAQAAANVSPGTAAQLSGIVSNKLNGDPQKFQQIVNQLQSNGQAPGGTPPQGMPPRPMAGAGGMPPRPVGMATGGETPTVLATSGSNAASNPGLSSVMQSWRKAGATSAKPPVTAATGGALESASRHVKGPGDGTSDSIPARLANGEYVIDAQTVSMLGNGDNGSGAKNLDQFRANIRKHKGAALAQGKMAPNAKPIHKYMGGGK